MSFSVAHRRDPLNLAKTKVPRGVVHVIPRRCKGCSFCIEFCPQEVFELSESINAKGYHFPVVAQGKEDDCVHCQFCDLVCPEFAIYTTAAEADDDPQTEAP